MTFSFDNVGGILIDNIQELLFLKILSAISASGKPLIPVTTILLFQVILITLSK